MNITTIVEKKKCTGCRVCEKSCPINAVSFVPDAEGFIIPNIDESKCVDCSKCYLRCPSAKENKASKTERGLIVQCKNNNAIRRSASGGVFVGLAKYFLSQKNALVIGASLCDDLVTRHIAIDRIEDIKLLQNSKYVQSDIGNMYSVTEEALKNGRTVFFTGCPCQIAGLYASLSKKYENLYTADIVCHGVPSPTFLKREISESVGDKKGKVVSYKFRHKKPIGKSNSSYMMMMMMERGLPIIRRPDTDPYFNCFMKGMSFRESCYQCNYANLNRVGDFTMGDCDSQEYYPNFHPEDSNSILLLNSKKAEEIFEIVKEDFDFSELDVEREAAYNHQLSHPFVRPVERDEIYQHVLNDEWGKVQKQFAVASSKAERWKLLLLAYMPNWIIKIYGGLKDD